MVAGAEQPGDLPADSALVLPMGKYHRSKQVPGVESAGIVAAGAGMVECQDLAAVERTRGAEVEEQPASAESAQERTGPVEERRWRQVRERLAMGTF